MSSPVAPPPLAPRPPAGRSNGLAVGALVVGIVAFLVGLIPFVGLLLGATAVVLGVLALRRAMNRGLAVAGLVLGAVAGLTGLITTLVAVVAIAGGATTTSAAGAAAMTEPNDAGASAPAASVPVASAPVTSAPVASPAAAAEEEEPAEEAEDAEPAAGADYGGYTKKQTKFVSIVEQASDDYSDASTELKGAKVLSKRDSAACKATGGGKVKNWVGTVHGIGATGDGNGWIEIEIAPTIVVQTWNNELSDVFDETLVSPSKGFYDRMTELSEGDRVEFSGKFVPSDSSCVDTTNLTKTFNAEDPDFLFRFTDVRAQ